MIQHHTKNFIILLIVSLILILSVHNAWEDTNQTHSHDAFFNDVHEFMSRGGRNTAAMGKELCERVNVLESNYGLTETDCKEVYK